MGVGPVTDGPLRLGACWPREIGGMTMETPRQRWGTSCPHDPECEHSYLDDRDLTRWMDTALSDDQARLLVQRTEHTADVGYQPVICADCGRSYTCTLLDDYYEFTTAEDGVCLRCLLARHNLQPATATSWTNCTRYRRPIGPGPSIERAGGR